MRPYLVVAAIVFGLLVVVHLWRASVEGWAVLGQPLVLGTTAGSAVLCAWAIWLLRRDARRDG